MSSIFLKEQTSETERMTRVRLIEKIKRLRKEKGAALTPQERELRTMNILIFSIIAVQSITTSRLTIGNRTGNLNFQMLEAIIDILQNHNRILGNIFIVLRDISDKVTAIYDALPH